MAFLKSWVVGFSCLLCVHVGVVAADTRKAPAASYYRYTTVDGRTEVGRQVPVESIAAGYDILDKRMRTIRKVKPAPTAEEIALKQKRVQQQKSDERLLKTFATAKDAERARDRKIAALDVIVNISSGNIRRLNLEYETLAGLAAAKSRRNLPVPEHIKSNMTSIERQILEAKVHIQTKEDEKTAIYDSFKSDIARLNELEVPR